MPLSEKSRAILEAIANGHTYEQILVHDSAWTYHDIFQAATEALEIATGTTVVKAYSIDEIRTEHRHAYEKWDVAQDEQLRELHRAGKSIGEMALAMQRRPGGIKSRLAKLNLVEPAGGV